MSDSETNLSELQRFLTANGYVLSEKPWLLFQQAANQNDDWLPARLARERLDAGLERRPWLRWLNKSAARDRRLATLIGHTSGIRDCALSPDASQVVSASEDGTLKLWETSGRFEGLSLSGHRDVVSACDFSPDGALIVSGSWDGSIRLWDAHSGIEIAFLAADAGKPHRLGFSPSGDMVLGASLEGQLRVWDVCTRRELSKFAGALPKKVRAFQLSTDGLSLLMFDGVSLSLWDIESGGWITGAQAAIGPDVMACALAPDSQRAVCCQGDYRPGVYDLGTGDQLGSLEGHTDICYDCAFSPDGRLIATASADTTVRLWDAESLAPLAVLSGHASEVWRCRFARDGSVAVSASSDGSLRLWDLTSSDVPEQTEMRSPVRACAFSRDGKLLAAASSVQLSVREAKSGDRLASSDGCHQNWIDCEFSADGDHIACTSDTGVVQMFDAASCQLRSDDWLRGTICQISSDWSVAATTRDRGHISIWDLNSREERGQMSLGSDRAWARSQPACRFSPDGKLFIVADGRMMRVFNVATGQEVASWQHEHEVLTCAFSASGHRVVSVTSEGELWLCDTCGQRMLSVTFIGSHKAWSFSNDGRRFAAAVGGDVTVWDSATGLSLCSVAGHPENVSMVVFSRRGDKLFTLSGNSLLRCSEVATGNQLYALTRDRFLVFVCPSPDDRLIALGFDAGPVELIDVETGKEVCAYWPAGGPRAFSWSAELAAFAVGTYSGDLYILRGEGLA